MKLSEHINHCILMMAKFGDKDVSIVHKAGEYDSHPLITHSRVSPLDVPDNSGGKAHYEISRSYKGQFK